MQPFVCVCVCVCLCVCVHVYVCLCAVMAVSKPYAFYTYVACSHVLMLRIQCMYISLCL